MFSELVLGFMVGHCRNIFKSIDRMQNGNWIKNGGVQLSNRVVGIVGLGHIGLDLARLLQPFGCKIQYFDIVDKQSVAADLGATSVTYDELVSSSDIVSFHVPGGSQTFKMFGPPQIEIAKSVRSL